MSRRRRDMNKSLDFFTRSLSIVEPPFSLGLWTGLQIYSTADEHSNTRLASRRERTRTQIARWYRCCSPTWSLRQRS